MRAKIAFFPLLPSPSPRPPSHHGITELPNTVRRIKEEEGKRGRGGGEIAQNERGNNHYAAAVWLLPRRECQTTVPFLWEKEEFFLVQNI